MNDFLKHYCLSVNDFHLHSNGDSKIYVPIHTTYFIELNGELSCLNLKFDLYKLDSIYYIEDRLKISISSVYGTNLISPRSFAKDTFIKRCKMVDFQQLENLSLLS